MVKSKLYQDGIILKSNSPLNDACPFCSELEGISYKKFSGLIQCEFDSRIVRPRGMDDLMIFPDISPLKHGHFLISTCEHIDNYSVIKNKSTIENIEKLVIDISLNIEDGNELFFFEHGTSSCISKKGCVQHAHVHIIPVICGTYEQVVVCSHDYGELSELESRRFISLHESLSVETDTEHYVLFGRCGSDGRIKSRYITSDFIPSQLMRYVLSDVLKLPMHIDDMSERKLEFRKSMSYLNSCLLFRGRDVV